MHLLPPKVIGRRLLPLMVAVLVDLGVLAFFANNARGDYSENFDDIADVTAWPDGFNGASSKEWGAVNVNLSGVIPDGLTITRDTTFFSIGASGGVQRGTGCIMLLSTGATSDNSSSAAIDLFLDFTGRPAGNISFDAATVFNSTGNRAGTLRLYASVDGTNFSEVVGVNLPYVAYNNTIGSASVSAALPASFSNCATARLRFYYHNGTGGETGSRPKISIDNILVTNALPKDALFISSVSPNPVIGSNGAQPFTINGSGFVEGCNVILRDLTTGQPPYQNRVISSFSNSQITINPNFTTEPHRWSVEVKNPDEAATEQFEFQVSSPYAQGLVWRVEDGGNGHSYSLSTPPQSITWSDARDAAIAAGGHLATITSAAENAFIVSLGLSNRWTWVGASQTDVTAEPLGGWTWVTGEPMDYQNWSAGEPNNLYNATFNQSEDWMMIFPDGKWNDHMNVAGEVVQYVIEFESPRNDIDVRNLKKTETSYLPGQTHLGHDYNSNPLMPLADVGKAVVSPVSGFVASFGSYGASNSYGDLLVAITTTVPPNTSLKRLNGNSAVVATNTVTVFLGHLSPRKYDSSGIEDFTASTVSLNPGDPVIAGQTIIGYVAPQSHNGGWTPHIHVGMLPYAENGLGGFTQPITRSHYPGKWQTNDSLLDSILAVMIDPSSAFPVLSGDKPYSISGTVVDANGQGISGLPLILASPYTLAAYAMTDLNGQYEFSNLSAGGNFIISIAENDVIQSTTSANVSLLESNAIVDLVIGSTQSSFAITENPQSQNALVGDNILLATLVIGSGPFQFQWQFNGVDLNEQTNPTLDLNQIQKSQSGSYRIKVTRGETQIYSNPAIVNVYTPFEYFQILNFTAEEIAEPSFSAWTAMPMGDGVSNGYKFLFNIDPSRPMTDHDRAALPKVVVDPGASGVDYLGLTFRLNALAGDEGFVLKKSPDLSPNSWQTVVPDLWEVVDTDAQTGDEIIRLKINVSGQNKQFLQIDSVQP